MNFINPSFLYGLFALSIPIIIHLFNFRKAKKVYFSNTRFLQHVKETSSAKRRLKHYLVLLSRLLFLFFLVLAFAQPILQAEEKGLDNEFVSIYIDTSKSMENLANSGGRAIDEALEYVRELINIYPRGTKFRLITNDFASFSNSYKSAEKIEDYVTELTLSGVGRTIAEVENRRRSLAQAVGSTNEDVYILGDFQTNTIGTIDEWQLDSTNTYHLLPIQFEKTSNLSIDSLYLETPFILDKEHVSLIADVHNYGREAVNNVNLKVFVEEVLVSSTSVSLEGGETQSLTFDISYSLKNENKARIVIDDYPVTFDDEFYFVINTTNRINVLEINDNGTSSIISKVYGNQSLFNVNTQSIANIDYSLIGSSDLVVINQVSNISTALIAAIKNYVTDGGRLLIVPSADGDVIQYEQLMVISSIQNVEVEEMEELSKPDLNDPFFANIFEDRQVVFNMPTGKPTVQWRGQNTSLLQFKLGTPFLTVNSGVGKVFMMASPLSDEFTNFHKHAIFVPIMYKIATYKSRNTIRPYYFLNEFIIRTRLDTLATDLTYKINQGNTEVIPEQRIVGIELIMEVPKQVVKSGFAAVQFENEHKLLLAFNNEQEESNLLQMSMEEITEIANRNENINVYRSTDAQAFSKEIKAKYLGQALWKYAIILALLFLLAEILIIRLMR